MFMSRRQEFDFERDGLGAILFRRATWPTATESLNVTYALYFSSNNANQLFATDAGCKSAVLQKK
jgi:hypothetical protein